MTNKLTRIIMGNIVEKCSNSRKGDIERVNLSNKEIDMIKNIIHKENSKNEKVEATAVKKNNDSKNYVTLEELINNRVVIDKEEGISENEQIERSYGTGIKKVSLEDIVPKVSLASIGKKR